MKNVKEKHKERNAWKNKPVRKKEKAKADSIKPNELFTLREIKLKHSLGCNHVSGSSWCEKLTCF